MERIFSLLILVILVANSCKNSVKKMKTESSAQMDFKEITSNLEVIPNESLNKCSFEFRNTSKLPLVI